ncbi:MAG: BamA/TamA family outer membrane protein [Chthoniobacterales bacterium]|nr:BamA/TamA family outer membrane protein [Chthoniobacterales bacterium]
MLIVSLAEAQTAVQAPHPEQRDREQHAVAKQQNKIAQNANVEFRGIRAFDAKALRSQLKEQIAAIEQFGLTAARADDAAFFLEVFYRKHGYSKVDVQYSLLGGNRLRLAVSEGPLVTLGSVNFVGNSSQPSDKLFDYAVGPTRERYSKAERKLPFVASDLDEGVDLVRRVYVAEGFLDSVVQPPRYRFSADGRQVDVTIAIVEGRRYSFGGVSFRGRTVFAPAELQGELRDLLEQPYTDGRVSDIPRRLEAYYKARGYYEVKIDAIGEPQAARAGRVPVQVTIAPGPLYRFDGVSVTGLRRLRPSYVERRFTSLSGKVYNPKEVDERFRKLMRSGLFTNLQIKPVPVDGDQLRLEISAEEAKSKEFGFSLGYGTYAGAIVGASYRDRNLFGYGRPLTTSAEISQRGYKGEITFEDPYLFDTENHLKAQLSALTFDFDGYSKFEIGGRVELSRDFTKEYHVGVFASARHVKLTSSDIAPFFLGRKSYEVNTVGFTQTLDLRENPFVSPRGFIFDNTFDIASDALGSQVEFIRSTARVSFYLPFASRDALPQPPGITQPSGSAMGRWFRRSSLALGARAGIIYPLSGSGSVYSRIPIDERFFNGGSSTVRSFTERDLGPHDRGDPIGGEFFSVFNVEYTFPIFGELQGAIFYDAGNLLPGAKDPFARVDAGLQNMRYAIGVGLRYQLPIGPIRLDYGVNPDPRFDEAAGAFHFSFGFAF